jgi:twitching motility protein PilU
MNIDLLDYLRQMLGAKASDIFFSVGAPPSMKIDGSITPLGDTPLTAEAVDALAKQAMSDRQQREFEETMEMNLAIDMPDVGRFRVNIYRQRGNPALAIRFITSRIPSLEQLNLPPVLHDLALVPRGLVLVVGAAGAGKSTTLASMIDHLNMQKAVHVLTVKDPIEYLHMHKKSIVDQREVGLDTLSYANALRNTMREAPDVLMIGEIRDQETMQAAIAYAETGHLCVATLHANNANQTLDRIVNFFPDSAHHQVFVDLSLNLKAVVSQRLLRGVDGRRLPAVEILLSSPFIAELIEKGGIAAIRDASKQSFELGMLTFDESITDAMPRAGSATTKPWTTRIHLPTWACASGWRARTRPAATATTWRARGSMDWARMAGRNRRSNARNAMRSSARATRREREPPADSCHRIRHQGLSTVR